MSARTFRFTPPPIELSPELRWVLLRAVGPAGHAFRDRIDPSHALELARAFNLSSRLTTRADSTLLASELGRETAKLLVMEMLAVVARERALARTGRRVAEIAAECRVPLVFLKFAALQLSGVLAEGSRGAVDVDVLVPEERAHELQQALQSDGFDSLGLPGSEHQLPTLKSPLGGGVEVHHCIPGLRESRSGTFLTAEKLIESKLVAPASSLPGLPGADLPADCLLPNRELLVAHAIVHGFAQHGPFPHAYPMARMFADLVDLGVAADGYELSEQCRGWLENEMTHTEIDAVLGLCGALARGEDLDGVEQQSPEGLLLGHWVAGVLEPNYRQALKVAFVMRRLTARTRSESVVHTLRSALAPNRAQLERIYGPAESDLQLLARRVFRPADLVYRLGKYGWSYARLKASALSSKGRPFSK